MVVRVSATTEEELWSIWAFNVARYGVEHADRYVAFLRQGTQTLASEHEQGRRVEGLPGLRSMVFRRDPRGDGHIAVYEVDFVGQTIDLMHAFHTKQDVSGRLRAER